MSKKRNLPHLLVAQAAGQLLLLAPAPIITRVLAEDVFGAFGVYSGWMMLAGAVSILQLNIAIQTLSHDAARRAASLAFFVVPWTSACFALLYWILSNATEQIARWDAAALLFLGASSSAMSTTFVALDLRFKDGQLTPLFYVLRPVAVVAMQAVNYFARLGSPELILVYGAVWGECVTAVFLYVRANRTLASILHSLPRISLFPAFREMRDFPVFHTLQVSMATAGWFLPVAIASHRYGLSEFAHFALAQRLALLPARFLSEPLRAWMYQTYLPIAESKRYAVAKGHTWLMLLLAILVFGVLRWVAVPGVSWVFGAEWERAGRLLPWLTLWTFGSILAMPSNVCARFCGLGAKLLRFEAWSFAFRATAVLIVCYTLPLESASAGMSLAAVSSYLLITAGLLLAARSCYAR